jgi:hypothetical protein
MGAPGQPIYAVPENKYPAICGFNGKDSVRISHEGYRTRKVRLQSGHIRELKFWTLVWSTATEQPSLDHRGHDLVSATEVSLHGKVVIAQRKTEHEPLRVSLQFPDGETALMTPSGRHVMLPEVRVAYDEVAYSGVADADLYLDRWDEFQLPAATIATVNPFQDRPADVELYQQLLGKTTQPEAEFKSRAQRIGSPNISQTKFMIGRMNPDLLKRKSNKRHILEQLSIVGKFRQTIPIYHKSWWKELAETELVRKGSVVSMDMLTGFPRSQLGNTCLRMFHDLRSGNVFYFPGHSHDANAQVEATVKYYNRTNSGMTGQLDGQRTWIVDQGTELCNQKMTSLATRHGINIVKLGRGAKGRHNCEGSHKTIVRLMSHHWKTAMQNFFVVNASMGKFWEYFAAAANLSLMFYPVVTAFWLSQILAKTVKWNKKPGLISSFWHHSAVTQ